MLLGLLGIACNNGTQEIKSISGGGGQKIDGYFSQIT